MKQTVMSDAAPFLPKEIMTNILKRLPVKSLMRFRCVCKHWKDLFKTPSFVSDHLCHFSHQNPSVLFFQSYGANPLQLRLLDCEMQVRDVQKAPQFDSSPSMSVNIIGSCNGLLCVEVLRRGITPKSLLLWNPATRDVREVPSSRAIDYGGCNCLLGFGFSPLVNDYKIVAIAVDYSDITVRGAEAYSLSRDSWKEIEVENLEDVTPYRDSVSSNGAIFWYGSTPGEEEEEEDEEADGVIVSFDIAMEVFTLIPWPPLSGNPSFTLTVYEDNIAMITELGIGDFPTIESSIIELWVVEEDIGSSEEGWNWTRKFTSGPCPWTFHPGTIWRDEIVTSGTEIDRETLEDGPKSGLCMFNVTTNEFKMLPIANHCSCCVFLNYVESIVPVASIQNIEER
ncbi:F-box/kelch-repeat protein At3g23880-like [Neltuma alba]|uniref:F-box/kelch-repeat protein At3g23880-like n=1 Tax=Neltuma alba TaxID=207710 RepID=UPI0010A42589|nr:F-box/kelch-repeat protein At3g23880-like [Prosopis alba]